MYGPQNFSELVGDLIYLISLVIPIIFSLTLVVIIWKIVDAWIFNPGEPTKIAEGKQTALIGIIALVIMSGIWGILSILRYSLFGV
ncbi:MAG: hypothetical protein WDZ93_01410 [Candidatus Paceibacterota bacterium]